MGQQRCVEVPDKAIMMVAGFMAKMYAREQKGVSFMATTDSKLVIRFGLWSAVLTVLFSIGYITL